MGTEIHRVHDRKFEATSFNPGLGRPTRFAPLRRPDGSHVPTAYAAQTFECAVHETIFHEIQHDAPRKTVRFGTLEPLSYARLEVRHELSLAALFEPDLNAWKLRRAHLIDTFASEYERTAAWALAIHDAFDDVAGLVWTSRRCDPSTAFVLFGDRVPRGALKLLEKAEIVEDDDLLLAVRNFGARAGITITL